MESDPSYNINVTGDIKQMLKELGTEKAKEIALHGGGGSKAKGERAAALASILAARSRIKEDPSGDAKPKQAYSIVDAASASVNGRSAAAAKTASSDKVAARIALHMAGERTPVNAKLVRPCLVSVFLFSNFSKCFQNKIENKKITFRFFLILVFNVPKVSQKKTI